MLISRVISLVSAALIMMPPVVGGIQTDADRQWALRPKQSVYVVAVKASPRARWAIWDRYLRDVIHLRCGKIAKMAEAGGGPPLYPEPPTLERSILDQTPMISTDPLLQSGITSEFIKLKEFRQAVSADSADFVFIAFGMYPGIDTYPYGNSFIDLEPGNDDPSYSASYVEVLSFLVPASIFRRVRKDVASLSDAAQWQGYATSSTPVTKCGGTAQQAVAGALVSKLHRDGIKKSTSRRPEPIARRPVSNETIDPSDPNKASEGSGQARGSAAAQGTTTIKVETSLVVVPISVLDKNGRAVPNLTRQDFQVLEENVEQEINHFSPMEAPFHVALLIDTSGSMRLNDGSLRKVVGNFIQNLQPQDQVMVVSFNSEVYLNSEFTNDRYQLGSAFSQIRIGGGTRLYDAVDLVLLERLRQVDGRKAIVLFTDGVDTESRVSEARHTLELAEESGTLIYTIRYDTAREVAEQPVFSNLRGKVISLGTPRPNILVAGAEAYRLASQYLSDLPERTGSRAFQAQSTSSLNEPFSTIAGELRQQYELSYYPTNPAHDGSYRRILVRVDHPDVVVRARPGYRAAKN
ncbi:MAG TPA: VWA domain-containing protein [Acidobacteriota bacterium]|nr:VWA domain-containing protein [Acidobacteriota bacterium]